MNEYGRINNPQHIVQRLREHPNLTFLFIELTDRCNLACMHCGSRCERNKGQFIDTKVLFSALETISEDFDPRSIMICLTGGEPMLHPDFYAISEKIISLGFSWGMTTNGTLIHAEQAKKLKEHRLSSVTISIDGTESMHDWFRNTPGCYQKAVEGIGNLQKEGIQVDVVSVMHKKNLHELDTLYELMCNMNIANWRVINMEPIGRALDLKGMLLSQNEFEQLLHFIQAKRQGVRLMPEVMFGCSHYLSLGFEGTVRDHYFYCGSGTLVASILCNGDIYSCLDIERRPELIQGNINKDRFSKVWFEKFKEFRTDRTESCDMCKNCNERNYCNGDSAHTWDYNKKRPLFCYKKGLIDNG